MIISLKMLKIGSEVSNCFASFPASQVCCYLLGLERSLYKDGE